MNIQPIIHDEDLETDDHSLTTTIMILSRIKQPSETTGRRNNLPHRSQVLRQFIVIQSAIIIFWHCPFAAKLSQ